MLPLVEEWSILIFVDWMLGKRGWGIPTQWVGTLIYMYFVDWFFWFIFPLISMLYWRYWVRKQPDYDKMDEM